jgi:hypothetical protein
MTTEKLGAVHSLDPPAGPHEQRRGLRLGWSIVTGLLATAVFLEAVFAGALLSGVEGAREAHAATAVILIASTITAGLVGALTLRRIAHGPRLGLTLAGLAAAIFLQTALGKLSAGGANLLWLHVPVGVALAGFALRALAAARRLGSD